jgi:hypothetical protein
LQPGHPSARHVTDELSLDIQPVFPPWMPSLVECALRRARQLGPFVEKASQDVPQSKRPDPHCFKSNCFEPER